MAGRCLPQATGNCCLSNDSHFQQTPIPIFHLVFKIAAKSPGLLVTLTCRRAKTGKRSQRLNIVDSTCQLSANRLTVNAGQYGQLTLWLTG